MTDNIELDLGSGGAIVKTDDDGAAHWQYVKVSYGADDTQTRVTATVGLPVELLAGSAIIGTVNLGAVDNAVLDVIAAQNTITAAGYAAEDAALGSGVLLQGDDGTNRKNVNVDATTGDLQVDVTNTVTVAAHAVTNAGVFAVQEDGAALTALQLIDDPVFADDAPFTLTSSKIMIGGGIRDDSLSALAAAEGDAIPFRFGSTGALHVTGGGGGTEYTEDVATPNPIVGTATMMERDDALSAITPAEGDWTAFRASAEGALWVQDFNSDAILADTTTLAGAVDSGAMQVKQLNTVSTDNSSTATLTSGSTFTGTGEDVSNFASVTVMMDASHDSATDGIQLQFSTDDSNWDDVNVFTYTAADGARRFQCPVTGKFFRVVYINGGTGQSHFRLQTILHRQPVGTTIHRLVDDTSPDRSAEIVKAAIIAQAAGSGDFVPVQATASGNLKTALEEIDGSLLGGGVEAGALLVTLASDGTGLVSVDDNGGSLTVDNSVLTNLDATISGSEQQVDIVAALPAGTNAIGKLAANSGVDIGDVDVTSIAVGANLVGDVGISGARTSGGTTLYKNIDVDESEDQVKGTAGQVYWIHAINLKATPLFLKLYNATAASVTVGTTVPDLTFPVPSAGDTNGAGFTLAIPNGIAFSTAITIAATTGVADNDSGAPGANELIVNLGYA